MTAPGQSKLKAWFLLFRPWSYTATLVPFLLGLALGVMGDPRVCESSPWRWALAFASGLFFQAVVNLLNTWGDERSGVDSVPGAIRTTPQIHDGIISMRALLTAAVACAVLAAVLGLPTAFFSDRYGGLCVNWPLLVAAFVGFLGATNYSTGIKFKYRGLGVPFVSFLMGPLETFAAWAAFAPHRATLVCSADFGSLAFFVMFVVLASLPIALLVGVIMHGNDMRDIASDRAAGIRTLATTLGPGLSLVYFWACHVLPYVMAAAVAAAMLRHSARFWPLLLPLLSIPLSARALRRATSTYFEWRRKLRAGADGVPPSPPWRMLERGSGAVHFVFGVLYATAVVVSLACARTS